ncbi:MAG: hypothetical protein HDT37_09870 [Clostridiales bacterium]|nr:hypothetical protein [Clostridiales bacterium]
MARGKKTAKELSPEEKLQQALVPAAKQPYPVPENWCYFYFTSLIDIEGGTQPPKSQFADTCKDGYIRLAQIRDFATDKYTVYVPDTPKMRHFNENDIMIARYGASLGRICTGLKGVYNVALAKTIFSDDVLCRRYVYWMLQSESFQAPLMQISRTAQAGFNKDDLSTFAMPLPPYAEQQRIVARIESLFTKLDEAKEKAQAVVGGFELRKSAILHKAFTGELTEQWRKEHGVVLDSWESVALADICEVNPKKINTMDLPDNLEVSFFPMPALSEIYGEITEPQTRLLKEVRTGFTNFSEGDVVFAKITPCMENGKSAVIGKLVNNIGFGTTEFFVLRCTPKLYNRYLYHLLRDQHFRDEAKAVMAGAVGQQRVPKSFLEEYPLQIPLLPEQKEIVQILDVSFAKEQHAKETAEAVLAQIDTMKKAILARAFRGELGTNDPAEEWAGELLKTIL